MVFSFYTEWEKKIQRKIIYLNLFLGLHKWRLYPFQAETEVHKILKISPYLKDIRSYYWWKVRKKKFKKKNVVRFGFLKHFTKIEKNFPSIRW